MKEYNWEDYTDEDIKEEISFIHYGMSKLPERPISEIHKQKIADEYLDKLNSLYNEQRKRSTFKNNLG
jgi:hypothetical protein